MKHIRNDRAIAKMAAKMKNRRLTVIEFPFGFSIRSRRLGVDDLDGKIIMCRDNIAFTHEAFEHLVNIGITMINARRERLRKQERKEAG